MNHDREREREMEYRPVFSSPRLTVLASLPMAQRRQLMSGMTDATPCSVLAAREIVSVSPAFSTFDTCPGKSGRMKWELEVLWGGN